MKRRTVLAGLFATALAAPLLCQRELGQAELGQTKLLRFPDLYGDQVVFTYAGDLWLASATGGTARHLTSHPGIERFARFSPDGGAVAFTGQYDGDEQVYVVSVEGGSPRQLTFYPAAGPLPERWGWDNQVYGWRPDGSAVLFRSLRDGWDLGDTQLFTVPKEGGLPTALPMPQSGGGAFSPDAKRVVYSPVTRDFRHWKRYQGGWAQDLWIFDLATHAATQVTHHPRSDRDPMWMGETIYFSSDRDGKLNLYAYDTQSGATSQLTRETLWDVRWPSADESTGRIVFELDGELRILDPRSGTTSQVAIRVPTDLVAKRPSHVTVDDNIEDLGISPGGERALFSARGDIFTVPIEHGPTRNLTRSSGAHDRAPDWSPDGKRIAFVSDRSGEEEIWSIDERGHGEPVQLTDGNRGSYSELLWSPDSRHLAYHDQAGRLFVLDTQTREVVLAADDPAPFGLEYEWSPAGDWLALSLADRNGFRSIFLWRHSDRTLHRVTGELFNEFSPGFSQKGDYLYFIGDREFHPLISSFEFDYAVDRESYLYALALRSDVAHPFPPRSDEVGKPPASAEKAGAGATEGETEKETGEPAEGEGGAGEEGKSAPAPPSAPIAIDLEGLEQRVARVPVDADNYFAVAATPSGLLVGRGGGTYYGRDSSVHPELLLYDLEKRELKTLGRADAVALAHNRKRVLVQQEETYQLYDVEPEAKPKAVSTAGLAVDLVPEEEWRQIFDEVWRRFRDFFYVENMHGYDWAGIQEQYEPLLRYVGHRSDLNYVISEMIGELNVSHAYIAGGDWQVPERPHAGLLGARFERDGELYRIARLLPGHNEEPTYRSPLTEIGVNVRPGDYVLEINGQPLLGSDDPFRLLLHAGDAPVELLVNDRPDRETARRVLVEPIRNEDDLLYLEWVEKNRRTVEAKGGGILGYIHLPDMGAAGIREWIKWFYGQRHKQGLVIDIRSNGGGNVSPMVLERLERKLEMVDFERNNELDSPSPPSVFHGHLVCLVDEDTASDGDQFAYVFRQAGLGPLIGKRTWGGVVGIYDRGPLIDGATLSVPEAGTADTNGNWVIEGHGVDPDVVVENLPGDLIDGEDAQLERGIEILLEKIALQPRLFPPRPPPPVKTE